MQPQTLPQFLVSLYEYDPADETKDVFHEISIHRYISLNGASMTDPHTSKSNCRFFIYVYI